MMTHLNNRLKRNLKIVWIRKYSIRKSVWMGNEFARTITQHWRLWHSSFSPLARSFGSCGTLHNMGNSCQLECYGIFIRWPEYHHSVVHLPHYNDVIMSAMVSLIGSVSIVYSTVCSDADQRIIKAPHHWPLWGEFTGDRWIPRTKGQWRGKFSHLMTSSCALWNYDVLLYSFTDSNHSVLFFASATSKHISNAHFLEFY